MKITKEVRNYAEMLFNEKEKELRIAHAAPYSEREKEIKNICQAIFDKCKLEAAEAIREIDPSARVSFQNAYNHHSEIMVTMNRENFQGPNKTKFLAELSMGENLDDLTALVDKYFT